MTWNQLDGLLTQGNDSHTVDHPDDLTILATQQITMRSAIPGRA
jgi:hypothetical protein